MIGNQFAKHDVNGDKQLDKDEAKNLMKEVHGKFSEKEWSDDVFELGFKAADVNADGFIDEAELHAFLLERAKARGLLE